VVHVLRPPSHTDKPFIHGLGTTQTTLSLATTGGVIAITMLHIDNHILPIGQIFSDAVKKKKKSLREGTREQGNEKRGQI